jgi:perosamine synthetase
MIPVHDPDLGEAEERALLDCIRSGQAGGGSVLIAQLEAEFAEHLPIAYAIAVSSGTAALHLSVAALGIGRGDEVVVPSFAFAPCADVVVLSGATPVFVDSDPGDFTVDVEAVAAAITPRTRAVLAVHMYGHPCDLAALRRLCDRHALFLVEDCAQAIGARCDELSAGTVGDIGCFSLYANKTITAGEGGVVVTADAELAARVRTLRAHGLVHDPDRAYLHDRIGFNYRMPAWSAAVARTQLRRLPGFLQRRDRHAAEYARQLAEIPGLSQQEVRPRCTRHGRWAHTVLLDRHDRRAVAEQLRAAGIDTRGFYHPLHLHPAYAARDQLPVCESFASRGLVLPSGNRLSAEQVDTVCTALRVALT